MKQRALILQLTVTGPTGVLTAPVQPHVQTDNKPAHVTAVIRNRSTEENNAREATPTISPVMQDNAQVVLPPLLRYLYLWLDGFTFDIHYFYTVHNND